MRAYKIAMFLIIFNLTIPIVNALGIFESSMAGETVAAASWDWSSYVGLGVGLMAVVATLIFKLPVGAAVFAVTFTFTTTLMTASLSTMLNPFSVGGAVAIIDAVKLLVITSVSFVFLYGFIQLSSTYTGQ